MRLHEISEDFEELSSQVGSLVQQRAQTVSETTPEVGLHGPPTLEQNPLSQEVAREAEEVLLAKHKSPYENGQP